MRILIACEFSGVIRNAFAALGHDAWSCDFYRTERPGQHIQGNVLEILNDGWDLMIAHPPCTELTNSGAWKHAYTPEQAQAAEFAIQLYNSNIPKVAIENPIGMLSSLWGKPDQIIQPWMFGHNEQKSTCLWLKNLPQLLPTHIVERDKSYPVRVLEYTPGPMRAIQRSRTLSGIARAMAEQWGNGIYPKLDRVIIGTDVITLTEFAD